MQVSELQWTQEEQKAAREAFELARQRETQTLIELVREQSSQVTALDDIWHLHDFLSARRHDMDGKYDDRHPGTLFSLAQLIKEGWLHRDDLQGLDSAKLAKVSVLARM